MSKFSNNKRTSFLNAIPQVTLDNDNLNLVSKSSFNFAYFDSSQSAGQDFKDWEKE